MIVSPLIPPSDDWGGEGTSSGSDCEGFVFSFATDENIYYKFSYHTDTSTKTYLLSFHKVQ